MAAILLVAHCDRARALFGITRFAIHYLFPFCLFAALGARPASWRDASNEERFAPRLWPHFAHRRPRHLPAQAWKLLCLPPRSEATNLLPYARLAEELTQRGLGNAQFVTLSPRDAGNLAIALPEARALSLSARIEPPPPDPMPIVLACCYGAASIPCRRRRPRRPILAAAGS